MKCLPRFVLNIYVEKAVLQEQLWVAFRDVLGFLNGEMVVWHDGNTTEWNEGGKSYQPSALGSSGQRKISREESE